MMGQIGELPERRAAAAGAHSGEIATEKLRG